MKSPWTSRTRCASLLAAALVAATVTTGRAAPDEPGSPGGKPHRVHALVGATVVTRPGQVLEAATVVVRDGVIEAVGADVIPPPDARVHDARGLTIYPGLIEPYLRLDGDGGAKADDEDEDEDAPPPPAAPRRGGAVHANPAVRPDRSMADELALDADTLEGLRGCGFTAALLVPGKGVLRGQSALVSLRDGTPREQVVRARVAQHVALERGARDYPTALMGAIALVRQTLLDAQHHAAAREAYAARATGQERPETDASLDALAHGLATDQPFVLEAEDAQGLLRGVRVLGEADVVPWVVLGGCDAYRWLPQVVATGAPLTLSLNFPPAPRWDDEDEAESVQLDALRHWRLSPADAAGLEAAGARFAFTTQGLADRDGWRARVRQAIARGLSEDAALSAVTTAPAALLRAPQLGVIAPGGIADLTVTDGPLFAEHTRIVEVWVDGARYPGKPTLPAPGDVAGAWSLELADLGALRVKVAHARGELKVTFPGLEPAPPAAPARLWRERLTFVVPGLAVGLAENERLELELRVSGNRARGLYKRANVPGEVAGSREPDDEKDDEGEEKAEGEPKAEEPPPLTPLGPRAPWPPEAPGAPAAVLVKQATIWTQGPQGTVLGDLLCRDGEVVAVGPNLEAPGDAVVIDGRGRHVTPGIIDCHSHSFIAGGVNEWTSSCTAEVRVADVLDGQTVGIYRQLAGGVTTANMLHGSANAIGGQSATVQLRWGEPGAGLLLEDARPGIKFALGENPRRANWGQGMPPRYPTSRSGVEETIRERFLAARAYRRALTEWQDARDPTRVPPRVDLQLEALLEVLDGERLVHCHSYRQDEILAFIRLAEQQGFTIATFQHVLEGYKVAPELAAHGAGASTFADWWAYKFEVYDAIAYNPALLVRNGVLTSINSDSSEMARRLNQEAAKTMRYGGLEPIEALALVTINPARQLGVGDRLGSLEPGKQADFVLWSAAPLAMATIADETWIAGRRFYSRAADVEARALVEAERAALLREARAARWDDEQPKAEGWRPTFAGREPGHHEDDETRRRACACEGRP